MPSPLQNYFTTTNRDAYTGKTLPKISKLNFRRLNSFGAYVNAAFAGGVFFNPPTDSY